MSWYELLHKVQRYAAARHLIYRYTMQVSESLSNCLKQVSVLYDQSVSMHLLKFVFPLFLKDKTNEGHEYNKEEMFRLMYFSF